MKNQPEANPMLTTGKIAEQTGFSVGKVKKALQDLNIEPLLVKGNCSYYPSDCVEKIKKALS
jgi:hypothetical protein